MAAILPGCPPLAQWVCVHMRVAPEMLGYYCDRPKGLNYSPALSGITASPELCIGLRLHIPRGTLPYSSR